MSRAKKVPVEVTKTKHRALVQRHAEQMAAAHPKFAAEVMHNVEEEAENWEPGGKWMLDPESIEFLKSLPVETAVEK